MLLYDDYASYYPLCPPLADVPLDSCCLKQTLFPEYTPDILILPSDMREFVKVFNFLLKMISFRLVSLPTYYSHNI